MKFKLLPISLIVILFSSCYTVQNYKLSHNDPAYSFWENGKQFSYDNLDDVVVSVGFDAYYNKEYILDLAIDNRSDSTIEFDPSRIYAFGYTNDSTLQNSFTYFPTTSNRVIDSLTIEHQREEKRIKRNTVFSILLGAAALTATVAMAASDDVSPEETALFVDSQIETQYLLSDVRHERRSKMDELCWQQDYWNNCVLNKSTIQCDSIKHGKIHFKMPYAPHYVFYVPVNERIFRFAFTTSKY